MANIVSIGKLSDARIAELAEHGVEVKDTIDLDKLNLPEPGPGEIFCFHAEPDETAIFVEMYNIAKKLDKWERELLGNVVTELGGKIKKSDLSQPWYNGINNDKLMPKFKDEEEEEKFFRLKQKGNFLRQLLYWRMGERGSLHMYNLGIRKPTPGSDDLRVVKIQRRLENDFGQM